MEQKIIRLPAVLALTGLGKTLLYELIGKGKFPKPRQLGDRAVGWLESEVVAWVAERPTAEGGNPVARATA